MRKRGGRSARLYQGTVQGAQSHPKVVAGGAAVPERTAGPLGGHPHYRQVRDLLHKRGGAIAPPLARVQKRPRLVALGHHPPRRARSISSTVGRRAW